MGVLVRSGAALAWPPHWRTCAHVEKPLLLCGFCSVFSFWCFNMDTLKAMIVPHERLSHENGIAVGGHSWPANGRSGGVAMLVHCGESHTVHHTRELHTTRAHV